jgi:CheY-like chemotaxis protein
MTDSALIVDDSKTASVVLRKMLNKHDIDCAVVESGEDALEYLQTADPDVIFMDHMMPGMDGFETVKAIKADAQKSHIPIVMHTTRAAEGHIYIGQAKALGAVAILNKPPLESDLQTVLDRLNETSGLPEVHIEAVLPAQDADEPAINASLSQAESFDAYSAIGQSGLQESSRRVYPAITALLLLMLFGLLLFLGLERQQWQQQRQAGYNAIAWAVNQGLDYDYGELPLAGERLQRLRGLVEKLIELQFRGTLLVEGHVGAFCLQQLDVESGKPVLMLPDSSASLTECQTIGLPNARSRSIGQSEAFADFVLGLKLINDADIRIEILARGDDEPFYPYPADIEGVTAGDWNVVALRNNRVNVGIIQAE